MLSPRSPGAETPPNDALLRCGCNEEVLLDERSMTHVNLVVACTQRKRIAPDLSCHLRSAGGDSIAERARRWIANVDGSIPPTNTAADLYCGDYWFVAMSLPEAAAKSGVDCNIWIISAGYGLLSADSKVRSYSATFASGQADSVTTGLDSRKKRLHLREWWKAISAWQPHQQPGLRSIEAVAGEYPSSPCLVAVSADYVNAVQDDLVAAAGVLESTEMLSVITANGTDLYGGLSAHHIALDARVRHELGGTRHSLSVRLARRILENAKEWSLSKTQLQHQVKLMVDRQPPLDTYNRDPMSDDEVKSYIRSQLARDPIKKKSPLLRRLRDSGKACEQARFSQLYVAVLEESRGS